MRVECEEWRVELWCPAVRRTIGIKSEYPDRPAKIAAWVMETRTD
jgi:hypothetical protein